MAYNLKLSIFRVSLKTKGGSKKELKKFSEFYEEIYKTGNKENNYRAFIKEYVSSFDNKFKLNKDKTKGISVNNIAKLKLRSQSNLIDGEILGGLTGIPQTLFKQSNSIDTSGFVESDDVKVLPYFFKLWTPLDHNTGVLMVQSYSNLSIDTLIKLHLSQIFAKHKYGLIISNHIPKDVKEHYKDQSSVYKVAFVKESLTRGKRKMLNPIFTEFEGLKIRIEVSGFQKKVNEFWDEFLKEKQIISSNLEDFDIKENDTFKTIAYYKDEDGRRSNTTIQKEFDINPTIFLNSELKQKGSEIFDIEKIRKHTDSILLNIQKEMGYLK